MKEKDIHTINHKKDANADRFPTPNTIQNVVGSAELSEPVGQNEKTAYDLNLGGMMGDISDFEHVLSLAKDFDTDTIMVFVDKPWFKVPNKGFFKDKKIVVHGPLNVNMAAENDETLESSRKRLKQIVERCNSFADNIAALVLHPGNADSDERLVETLKEIVPLANFTIALETMSGQGRELGVTFEYLIDIRNRVGDPTNLKFCIDTCHIFAAGYDLSDPVKTITYICDKFGVENIAVFHINDSLHQCGRHRDAHAHIGDGYIPVETMKAIVQAKVFQHIPKILETPMAGNACREKYDYANDMKMLLS